MSSLLSAISGKFSTSLILGTFFPVTVFVFLARLLWVPMLPGTPRWLTPLSGFDEPWELLILTLVTLVLSGLLYNLNIPLIRFYEGYPWAETWIGRRKTARYRDLLAALQAQKEGLLPVRRLLLAEGRARGPADPLVPHLRRWIQEARSRETAVRREIFSDFPKDSSVLPTRLGNTIRSFENYAERQYSMAAITLWPRLVAVIEPAYAEMIDSAKASFDFMLNSATLAGLLSLLLLVTGLLWPPPFRPAGAVVSWLAAVVLLGAVAVWLYRQMIGSALDWGSLVRGAFDLYRVDLLKKLGYDRAPQTVDDERELWKVISGRLVEGDPPAGVNLPEYAPQAPPDCSCRCEPEIGLTLARGVVPQLFGRGRRIVLEVRHPAPGKPAADQIVVVDTVPDGYDYRWGSAEIDAGTVTVEGTNPYSFRLAGAPLGPGASRRLSYEIVPRGGAGLLAGGEP